MNDERRRFPRTGMVMIIVLFTDNALNLILVISQLHDKYMVGAHISTIHAFVMIAGRIGCVLLVLVCKSTFP